ncbi:MAG: Cobalamin biosynthesis protein CbiG [Paenibacillaceae bacterium]|jgi:cobalt-precorrin 5A hydrolase|nr:Cobalamin biosynthesis protein CbiG [Paenibacillaceae bacterium]
MNRVKLIAFTASGLAVARRIAEGLSLGEWLCETGTTLKEDPRCIHVPLTRWTADAFATARAVVFVGASGIAVRSIAPYLKSKETDPAVIVVDDNGRFAIPLVSGHIGGANRLAREIARVLGAVPVITTATDGSGCFAVDEWAREHNLAICGLKEAKAVSAALLAGKAVGFVSDFPVSGRLPDGVAYAEEGEVGIVVTLHEEAAPFVTTLRLIPRLVSIGIGCRKGKTAEEIARAVDGTLAVHGISHHAAAGVYSIDLKRDEPGLVDFCREWNLPFRTFSAEELSAVQGSFSASGFVAGVVGVDNVCERSAVLGSGSGARLVIAKQADNGVTVAAARQDYRISFE